MRPIQIGILGAGSFGTALAHLLSHKGHQVVLWAREKEIAQGINQNHLNPVYLKEIELGPLKATNDVSEACAHKELLLFSIPSQFVRSVLEKVKNKIPPQTTLVNTAKGIEKETLMTMSQVFADVLGNQMVAHYVTLSGPTFALELAKKFPTGASLASKNKEASKKAQALISVEYFRLYTNDDVIGVELGGALKNVMAIGTGIAEGLGFGLNTRAGHITRCLHEMTKLGVAMGAKPLTFSGLSGLGDLVLTCTGDLSRNRHVGLELGRGKKLQQITKNMKSVAEGVATAQSVHELAKKHNVEMVNAEYVYRILYEGLSPKQALKEILARELKEEMEGLK